MLGADAGAGAEKSRPRLESMGPTPSEPDVGPLGIVACRAGLAHSITERGRKCSDWMSRPRLALRLRSKCRVALLCLEVALRAERASKWSCQLSGPCSDLWWGRR